MRLAMIQRHTWPLGRFPGKPSARCFRQYSDSSGPSSDLANTTPPAKHVPNIKQAFYKISVQNRFEGTCEEFDRQSRSFAYERAVELDKFQGTYDAWWLESRNREPGACAYVSTLRLDKVIQTGQVVNISPKLPHHMLIKRFVLINGHSVGIAVAHFPKKYKAPAGTLLRMYYDSEKHLLRFQTRDGEPLPQNTGIDLISRARWPGYRPLLVLAHAEGLIPTLPAGHLPSFNLQTNLNSGYYVRTNRNTKSRSTGLFSSYTSTISLPDGLGTTSISFTLSEPEKFEYLRFFPYIHEDQTFRLWDIERGVDAPLKSPKDVGPWDPLRTKKRFPGLFEHAKRLGYWKEF